MTSTNRTSTPSIAGRFATTRWSVVVEAGKSPTRESQKALAVLCEAYWYPLYAFARRQGNRHEDARDLIQSFFENMLEKNGLAIANPDRGKFRSFLLGALKNFAAKQYRAETTQKRGGSTPHLSLDYSDGEKRYRCEPEDELTPDKIFERKWAITLLESVMTKLSAEQVAADKKERFEVLKMYLGGDKNRVPYAELGGRLNISAGAVKVAVHRLRKRYRELLRSEIADTVTDPDCIDEELQALFVALGK